MKILLLLCLLFCFSCSFTSTGKKRGRLSGAMKAASNDNKGSRNVSSSSSSNDDDDKSNRSLLWDIIFGSSNDNDDDSETVIYTHKKIKVKKQYQKKLKVKSDSLKIREERESDLFIPIKPKGVRSSFQFGFGKGQFSNEEHENNHFFEMEYVFAKSNANSKGNGSLSLFGNFNSFDVASKNKFKLSYKNPHIFNLGLKFNLFLNPQHTFLGVNLFLGVGYSHLSWSYNNPIYSQGDRITSDSVNGINFMLGAGVSIFQNNDVSLGLEYSLNNVAPGSTTSEGFDNDVFDSFSYSNLKLSFSINITE